MFINRQQELAFFNNIISRSHPGPAQMILLYGRRRVGKTALLLQWAADTDIPFTYWAAEKEPANLQRRKLFARILNLPVRQAPIFDNWAECWQAIANFLGEQRYILMIDELPYAAEADPATLSALQHAWDHYFQGSNLVIVLCGSQVRAMESLLHQQSPLFGRMTGQWRLEPLSFGDLREFFPNWSAGERVTAYAIAGGVPAYLNWLDPQLTLAENIRQVILAEGGMFLAEPTFLLYDEVREPGSYLAVLKAIGLGNHALRDISNYSQIATSHLSAYLSRLQELKMVERRLPATVPPAKRRRSRQGRYHLSDPYFRFYFRFIAPFHDYLPYDMDRLTKKIGQELPNFVGQTTYEELARQWVVQQGKGGNLPLVPDIVGSHWSRHVQVDVVALNWRKRQVLIGECKWRQQAINRQMVRDLIERTAPRLKGDLPDNGEGWRLFYAFFSRNGFAPAAIEELDAHGGLAVDLETLDGELGK
jgi:AAA+ ATPase superfamily predicted ATPase